MVIGSDDKRDPEYVPPGSVTLAWAARTTVIVTASHSEEERILTSMLSGSAAHSRDASGSEKVSGSEEVSDFDEASAPATVSQSASSDEADSVDYIPSPLTRVSASVVD